MKFAFCRTVRGSCDQVFYSDETPVKKFLDSVFEKVKSHFTVQEIPQDFVLTDFNFHNSSLPPNYKGTPYLAYDDKPMKEVPLEEDEDFHLEIRLIQKPIKHVKLQRLKLN